MEAIYDFEFTHNEIELLKYALRCAGIESYEIRAMYKELCSAVCNDEDTKILAVYE